MTDQLGPGVDTAPPHWLAPSLRLAAWTISLRGDRTVRRDIRDPMYNAARRLMHLARPLRVSGLYVVGQLPTPPTEGESEHSAETAWERIRQGGVRALDAAQRAAATLRDNARRLYDRWHEARETEARVLDELIRGMGDLSMTVARAPGAASEFLAGGGVVLLLIVGALMLSSSRKERY